MTKRSFASIIPTVAIVMSGMFSATYGQTIYFAEDAATGGVPPANPVNSHQAKADFLSHLAIFHTEYLDAYIDQQTPTSLTFGSVTASLSGPLIDSQEVRIFEVLSGHLNGGAPITGTHYLGKTAPTTANSFDITFPDPIMAFGFYGLDFGDQLGRISVTLGHPDGGSTTYAVPHTRALGTSGNVVYWGIVDPDHVFDVVTISTTNPNGEGYGLEDLTIADPSLPLAGDANLDGQVNALDLSVLASHWDEIDNIWAEGDFSGDGRVNAIDLSIIASNWLSSATVDVRFDESALEDATIGSIPEPTSAALLIAGTLLLLRPGKEGRSAVRPRAHPLRAWSRSTVPRI